MYQLTCLPWGTLLIASPHKLQLYKATPPRTELQVQDKILFYLSIQTTTLYSIPSIVLFMTYKQCLKPEINYTSPLSQFVRTNNSKATKTTRTTTAATY